MTTGDQAAVNLELVPAVQDGSTEEERWMELWNYMSLHPDFDCELVGRELWAATQVIDALMRSGLAALDPSLLGALAGYVSVQKEVENTRKAVGRVLA